MVVLEVNTLAGVFFLFGLVYAAGEYVCDNFLKEGWYRVTSGAGELMPTECPVGGSSCGTSKPIYISANVFTTENKCEENITEEDVYPSEGETVTRTAYEADLSYDCEAKEYTIQIKGCHGYYVYYLKPVTGCHAAYCFGNELPCPTGSYSETGFTPNCTSYPDVAVTPYVKANLMETEKTNKQGIEIVYSTAIFECYANDLTDDHIYKVRWYVNDREMTDASQTDLTKDDIVNGKARMLEEHWTPLFRPNMLVKCGLQVTSEGYIGYGPPHMSEPYFAGIKVEQKEYTVSEGEELEIPVTCTMPISCSWPKKTDKKEFLQTKACALVLLNGIPGYQADGQYCRNGISSGGVVFQAEKCGIQFTYRTWNETQMIKITGQSDNLVNNKDRLVFIRLYNSDEVTPGKDLLYWTNIHMPDIKVFVKDTDKVTLGRDCHSQNDPHMKTFDGKTWELQQSNGLTAGEYIMYRHKRLPLQVSAYFKNCTNQVTVLCNCGVAVRSGDSLFVANFCETNYKGVQRVNRYMIQRLCDDQSLVVEKTSTSYTITLPTGTEVTFNYQSGDIGKITIKASILDKDLTSGLCGSDNGNQADDFIPRGQFSSVTSAEEFASSWKVTGDYKDETLFHPDGKLKQTEYYGQEYCTCVTPVDNYPHGSPKFNCELTAAMETCRRTKTVFGVHTASCWTEVLRRKRDAQNQKREVVSQRDDDEPVSYPMADEEPLTTNKEVVEWKNGWTEDTARSFCENKFKSAPAYNICAEYVPFIDTGPYIDGCSLDIKHTGGDSWLNVTIRNYAGSCLQESKRLENLTSTNSTNSTGVDKPIAEIIEEFTCPDNCSNHGICVAGNCQCDPGYFGEICDGTRSRPPRIIKEAFEDLCDTNVKPCLSFLLYGDNFIEGADFKCKFTVVELKQNGTTTILEEGEAFIHPGTYVTPWYIKCKLPEARKKRSADFVVVATGYHISVSNDGISYTDPVTTIVYDSNCYLCNSTSMICEKQITCPVDEKEEAGKDKVPVIGIVVGVVAAVIVVLIIFFLVTRKYKTKDKYVRDSTLSLPNTSRQTAPRAHTFTLFDRDIFLSEKT